MLPFCIETLTSSGHMRIHLQIESLAEILPFQKEVS